MERLCYTLFLLAVTSGARAKESDFTDDEIINAFDDDKFIQYNPHALPPHSGPVTVDFYPKVQRIIDLDVESQILTSHLYLFYSWTDVRLQRFYSALGYTPDHSLTLSVDQVWTPDIRLYNSADTRQQDFDDVQLRVSPDGTIIYIPEVITRSFCPVAHDIGAGDRVNCTLRYGSWTHGMPELDLAEKETDSIPSTTTENLSREWHMVNSYVKRQETNYACCPESYVTLLVTLELERTNFVHN